MAERMYLGEKSSLVSSILVVCYCAVSVLVVGMSVLRELLS